MLPPVLLLTLMALPPRVAPGQHPRLLATAAELAATNARAEREPLIRQARDSLLRKAEAVFRTPFEGLPPFDDAANSSLMSDQVELGYGALLSGRQDWARRVADVLLAYAREYPTRPQPFEGRIYRYSLQEASWLTLAAEAADLAMASGVLSDVEVQAIAADLLRPCADITMHDYRTTADHIDGHHRCYNFQAWHCAAVGLVGYLLGEPKYIDWATDSDYGFKHLVSHDIRDDGLFWERSPGYSAYVVAASSRLCEAAWRNGTDLWNLAVPDNLVEDEWGSGNFMVDGDRGPKSFWMLLEGPFDAQFPHGYAAAISDSSPYPLSALIPSLELAVNRTGQAKLASILASAYARNEPAPNGWRTWAPNGHPAITSRFEAGRCVLSILGQSEADRGCWVSPVVATGGRDTAQIGLTYRTAPGTTGGKLRVHAYYGSKADPEIFDLVSMPDAADWTTLKHDFKLPEGADGIGLEIFLWHAAGRLDVNAAAATGQDGAVLLDPDDFTALTRRRPTSVRPWNLLPELPATEPPGPDGTWATAGVRKKGCSLFDATGMAVLRERWDDPQALAALLSWGPYGGGHGHPGMLELVVGGDGRWLVPALGTVSYDSPLHGSWTNTTLGHSTVVIDQVSQFPGSPKSAWGNATSDHKVVGELLDFQATDDVKLVRARCDNAYTGVDLDRTVALLDGVVVDRFVVSPSDGQDHTFDYVLHLPVTPVAEGLTLQPRGKLGDGHGYEHLGDLNAVTTDQPVRVTCGDALRIACAAAPGSELIVGTSPKGSADDRGPILLLRRQGKVVEFASVLQRGGDGRAVNSVVADGALLIQVGDRQRTLEFGDREVLVR